jgi:O-antigen/teichoic acid export membrane protein
MPRSLGRASLVLLGSTWTHHALSLLSSVMIARVLGPTAVGTLALNLGLAGLAMAALLPGFAQAHLKRLAEGQDAGRCLGTMLLIQGGLMLVVVPAVLVAWAVGVLPESPADIAVFLAMLGAQVVGKSGDAFLKVFLAREWVVAHGAVLLATRSARLAATAVVLAAAPSLPWIAGTFLLEALLTVVVAAGALAARDIRPRAPTRASLADYWRYARPFLITTPIALVQDSIDRVLVARWAGLTAAGYYHVARGLWEALSSAMVPPGMLLFTRLSSLYAERSEARARAARDTFFHGLDRLLFVCTPLTLGFWVVAPLAIELLYGAAFLPATTPMRILFLAAFAMNVVNPYAYVFLALDQAARLIPINVVRLGAYLVVLMVLVPAAGEPGWLPHGASGAAVARLFVVVVLCWVYFRWTRETAGIPFYRPAASYALALAGGLVVFHAAEAALRVTIRGAPALEILAGVAALAAYLAILGRLHAATRSHLTRTVRLFSPRLMREFLRERS